ncbi:MAG: hypothetical protein MUE60_09955, partial [Candidatus Eisenbacteria bacterium]|nr:hypothetical protein [Candidatus Eisenbacteria bacterium]
MVAKMMLTLAVLAWQTFAGDAFMPPAAATAPAGAARGDGFVANRGQAASPILFSGRSGQGRVACTRESIILDLPSADRCGGVAVALQFAEANPAAVRGEGAVVAVANYLRSADRNCWVTNVPVYPAVRHEGLYAGIDLVTRQAAAGLKLEFAVAPGADPRSIRMRYAGCERIRLDAQGALVMETPLGEVVDAAPAAYQNADGACRRVDIRYDLAPEGTIGFSVGPYDRTQTLTIDPLLAWSTFLGGSLSDHAEDVTSDASGDIYVTGHTFSNTDFPVTPGAYQTAFGGAPRDAFVAKTSADGSSLIWCTYLGGTGSNGEEGSSVSVAANGTVWIGGRTMSSDFPTTAGAFDQTYNGGVQVGDAYAALLSADGASLLYCTFLGGAAEEWAWGIETRNGLAYIAGFTSSPTFPTTAGAYDRTYNGVGAQFVGDAFLAVINPAGAGSSDLVYGSFIGGASDDGARGITVDASGAAHITGSTTSSGFPTTGGACQTSLAGASDAFVAIIAPLGGGATDLVYATYLGGAANDGGLSLDLDASGNVYLGGLTASSTGFPITSGACQSIFGGGTYDAFAAEITPAGGGAADLLYSTYLGGSGDETGEGDGVYLAHSGTGIRVSENGCGVYLHTITQSTDFPTTPGAYDRTFNGQDDAVLVKMMFAGQGAADLLYGTYLGGGGEEHWFGITVTSREDVAIACGSTSVDYPNSSIPSDYPTTAGSFQPTFGGGNEDAAITVCGFTDYGDAPDTYGTLESSNGPRHILGQLRLGIAWDAEPDGAPGGSADGDDLLADWPDDEDGVMLLGSGPPGGPYALPYQAGQNGAVRVTVTGIPPGQQAWLAA